MEGFILLVLALAVYLLPSIIAACKHKKNATAIFALNCFLGWTVIGWIGSFIWALIND